jgi:hypothetical protein
MKISGEHGQLAGVLPLAARASSGVIALAMDDKGIPTDAEGRLAIVQQLMGEARQTATVSGTPGRFAPGFWNKLTIL